MSGHALFVTIEAKPGEREKLLPLLKKNAEETIREEPGCKSFDAMARKDDPDTLYAFEIYVDGETLALHREAPHFVEWRAVGEALIAGSLGPNGSRHSARHSKLQFVQQYSIF